MIPSPKELDTQSPVQIDKWLEMDSEECRDLDSDYEVTKKIMKIGFDSGAMAYDSSGRVWGQGTSVRWYPLHFIRRNKKYGYRLAKKAAN